MRQWRDDFRPFWVLEGAGLSPKSSPDLLVALLNQENQRAKSLFILANRNDLGRAEL